MRIAVMQPYIFPFIGYFQLIHAVEKFIFYDDVNFMKKGWVNRNKILVGKGEHLFSVPIQNISQNKKIFETELSEPEYNKWLKKFIRTINVEYKRAPYFEQTSDIIYNTFSSKINNISDLAIFSINNVCAYLDIQTLFERSSLSNSVVSDLEKADRLKNICMQNNANHYINSIGGNKLYSKEAFAREKIKLSFLSTNNIRYNQFNEEFVPNLSIIDVLMFNSKNEIHKMLEDYKLC